MVAIDEQDLPFLTLAIIGFGLITILMTVLALLLAFKGPDRLVKAHKGGLSLGDFFPDSIFRNIVSHFRELLLLFTSSLMSHNRAAWSIDFWHRVFCAVHVYGAFACQRAQHLHGP